jgi:hypothetical protein
MNLSFSLTKSGSSSLRGVSFGITDGFHHKEPIETLPPLVQAWRSLSHKPEAGKKVHVYNEIVIFNFHYMHLALRGFLVASQLDFVASNHSYSLAAFLDHANCLMG